MVLNSLIDCQNSRGFTPLMEVCFRGYDSSNQKEQAFEGRLKIVDKLLEAGADPNYSKEIT